VIKLPATTGSTLVVQVTLKSALGATVTAIVPELLPGDLSFAGTLNSADTVLLIEVRFEALAGMLTMSLTATVWPGVRSGKVYVKTPAFMLGTTNAFSGASIDTNVETAGSVSVIVTPVAFEGPLLKTLNV